MPNLFGKGLPAVKQQPWTLASLRQAFRDVVPPATYTKAGYAKENG
jgi:hypothetical protein